MDDAPPNRKPSWLDRLGALLMREPEDREHLVELLRSAHGRNLLDGEALSMIEGALQVSEMKVREVMIPRTEVAFLDASLPAFRAASLVSQMPHSRYPVIGDSPDDVLGFVHVRDILTPSMVDRSVRLEDLAREVAFFPGSKQVIPALTEMRRGGHHLAVVA